MHSEPIDPIKYFSNELYVLINEELALVQGDVARVKSIVKESMDLLEGSFFSIQNKTMEQYNFIDSNINVVSSVDEFPTEEFPGIEFKSLVSDKHRSICSDLNEAMRALQSDDIVGQLSDRIAEHVGDIRKAVDILTDIHESIESEASSLEVSKNKFNELKERLTKDNARKIVSQENLDEGDIDIF